MHQTPSIRFPRSSDRRAVRVDDFITPRQWKSHARREITLRTYVSYLHTPTVNDRRRPALAPSQTMLLGRLHSTTVPSPCRGPVITTIVSPHPIPSRRGDAQKLTAAVLVLALSPLSHPSAGAPRITMPPKSPSSQSKNAAGKCTNYARSLPFHFAALFSFRAAPLPMQVFIGMVGRWGAVSSSDTLLPFLSTFIRIVVGRQ